MTAWLQSAWRDGWGDYDYIVAIRIMYAYDISETSWASLWIFISVIWITSFLLIFLLFLTFLLLLFVIIIITYYYLFVFDFNGHIIICSLRAARSFEERDFPLFFFFILTIATCDVNDWFRNCIIILRTVTFLLPRRNRRFRSDGTCPCDFVAFLSVTLFRS